MKKFKSLIKDRYVSIDNISEELKEKVSNLDGMKINECCCDCGCGCDDCCTTKCCEQPCDPCCCKDEIGTKLNCYNEFGRFCNSAQIMNELNSKPTTQTIYDLYYQFTRFTYIENPASGPIEPIYFGSYCGSHAAYRQNGNMPDRVVIPVEDNKPNVSTQQNSKIYKTVKEICTLFEFICPIVYTTVDNDIQIFAIKSTGTNGKENSIKSSLEEISKILGKLDSRSDIKWSQVLDVSIDNIDDLYTFLITFVFNPEKFIQSIKYEK